MPTENEPDFRALAQRLQLTADDQDAWRLLVRRFWAFVVGVCFHRLGGKKSSLDDAEDVAQDVFFRLSRALHANKLVLPDHEDTFRGLLAVVAGNLARDHLRRNQRQRRGGMQTPLELEPALPSPDPGPVAVLEAGDFLDHLLGRLDAVDQHLLWSLLAGNNQTEIAQELQLNPKTVQRRLAGIRNLLGQLHTAGNSVPPPSDLSP